MESQTPRGEKKKKKNKLPFFGKVFVTKKEVGGEKSLKPSPSSSKEEKNSKKIGEEKTGGVDPESGGENEADS